MKIPYQAPEFRLSQFNCPHCNADAHQHWCWVRFMEYDEIHDSYTNSRFRDEGDLKATICNRCKKYALWIDELVDYPNYFSSVAPNEDLDSDIKLDFEEAAKIMNSSPRGAAALLRLALQKLCVQLGEEGKNINKDIGSLVQKGLSAQIQKALDIVRVTGNEAVHPGQIDLRDNTETVAQLFILVNFIAEKMISEPKVVDALFESLPEDKKKGISNRDK